MYLPPSVDILVSFYFFQLDCEYCLILTLDKGVHEILARMRKWPVIKVVTIFAENYRSTWSDKYKMPSVLFTLCTCFVACSFNPIPPHFPIVCFVSFLCFLLRVHSTPFCLIFFTWQLKEADTRLHNKDNNLQTMLNELNTTISLKVNQAFTYALQAINCGRGRRMIFYPTDDV